MEGDVCEWTSCGERSEANQTKKDCYATENMTHEVKSQVTMKHIESSDEEDIYIFFTGRAEELFGSECCEGLNSRQNETWELYAQMAMHLH